MSQVMCVGVVTKYLDIEEIEFYTIELNQLRKF